MAACPAAVRPTPASPGVCAVMGHCTCIDAWAILGCRVGDRWPDFGTLSAGPGPLLGLSSSFAITEERQRGTRWIESPASTIPGEPQRSVPPDNLRHTFRA